MNGYGTGLKSSTRRILGTLDNTEFREYQKASTRVPLKMLSTGTFQQRVLAWEPFGQQYFPMMTEQEQ
jgi:hypothetical protein